MSYILSNQDTVLAQITQLESSITQTEVINVWIIEIFLKKNKEFTTAGSQKRQQTAE